MSLFNIPNVRAINNAHTFIDGWALPKSIYIDIGVLCDGNISIELMSMNTNTLIGVIDIFADDEISYWHTGDTFGMIDLHNPELYDILTYSIDRATDCATMNKLASDKYN